MSLAGQTHLVTGASDGIGLETARQLAGRGARVLVHGRTRGKAEHARDVVQREVPQAQAAAVWGDLARLDEVRALAAQVQREAPTLDVLVNNAGTFARDFVRTVDGNELTFQVNHLAPFLLTSLLLPQLKAAPQGRVVTVSSVAHHRGRLDFEDLQLERRFDGLLAYSNSKLANIHFTHELARRLAGTAVTAASLHPGVITTKLLMAGFNTTGASVESGAATSVYCATAPELATVTGRYYADRKEARLASHARDEAVEKRLWEASARLVGLPG